MLVEDGEEIFLVYSVREYVRSSMERYPLYVSLSTKLKGVICANDCTFICNAPDPAALAFPNFISYALSQTRQEARLFNECSSIPCTFMSATHTIKRSGGVGAKKDINDSWSGLRTNFLPHLFYHPTLDRISVKKSSIPHASYKSTETEQIPC